MSPALWPDGLEILEWWFDLQPQHTAFGLSVDARVERLTFWGSGAFEEHVRVVSEFLDGGNSGALARGQWEHSMATLTTAAVGTWLELSNHGAGGGWFIPGSVCATTAIATLEQSQEYTALRRWMKALGASELQRWTRSSFGSRLSTEFVVPLSTPLDAATESALEAAGSWTSGHDSAGVRDAFGPATVGIHAALGEGESIRFDRYIVEPTIDHDVALANLFGRFNATQMADLRGRLGREPSLLVVGHSQAEYYFELHGAPFSGP